MKMYKGKKACNADPSQRAIMEKAGWSIDPPKSEAPAAAAKPATAAAPAAAAGTKK